MSLRDVIALIVYYSLIWLVVAFGIYSVARSVTYIPYSDILLVGSAQAIGYFAALVTLVAPAGLGVRDAAFAWAVKAALPGRSFAVGSLISIAVRGVMTVGRIDVRRRRHRDGPPRGLGDPHRHPPSLPRGGAGDGTEEARAPHARNPLRQPERPRLRAAIRPKRRRLTQSGMRAPSW